MRHLTLALDIMGGDNGPHIILSAALKALNEFPHLNLIFCGDEDVITSWLNQHSSSLSNRYSIVHCNQQVLMDDNPVKALRHKKDSSMACAIKHVHNEQADACVSAGNTGALLAMACSQLKTLSGVNRPALVSSLPTAKGHKVYLLDLGATVQSDAQTLLQNAVMGSVLAEQIAGIERPRVAILNVGEEQIKGPANIKEASQLLAASDHLNYIGFVEGDDIFNDIADVIVTDGFSGNIALKSCEGLVKLLIEQVKRDAKRNILSKIMAKLAMPLLRRLYLRVNPDQYNGASLIGLRGIVVKSHGNASDEAFLYAIREAVQEAERQVPTKIKDKIENLLMERS
ncbi:phosphate:acyl-[acyl carrier protein] acyltransferase [Paraglaciecola sp. T6c]|uniref:Phosphate acyltransferase n=1 Tax=Pseudoalteromonas atlantica (strain T6c / ATCC BAA-1087) TaxID=3042615 RepID=PLSX_PSEA6|nr:phosphate acyltransferase PlsX [Paraglaciecola sp. T6c]Q15TZ5.1 RecName: Full=Phosphate acyltransferase; AltName: Full=Acyl-ACP phosphotransacylase; AltName: Full=Acyl-[acyl-carrier-protein]--phosphate acyltransferase; AltName: Full=Phosphate-acyl-ACP acyltransferase [Paraglaciecola sp. T6c]ABG40643.1 phosphate:acyl-[acyl carrier protein] acyltransferase [Paraglaciecola sp. T6c]